MLKHDALVPRLLHIAAASSVGLGLVLWSSVLQAEGPDALDKKKEDIACIKEFQGHWLIDGRKVEKPYQGASAGAVIVPDPEFAANDAQITIHFFSKDKPDIHWPNQGIKLPLQMPLSAGTSVGIPTQIWEAICGLIGKNPERYEIFAVRSGRSLRLREAVVKTEEGLTDLSPVFAEAPARRYLLECKAMSGGAENARETEPAPLELKPGQSPPASIGGLHEGLWRVSLLNPADEEPLGIDAWILVCPPEKYTRALKSFAEAQAVMDRLGAQMPPDEARGYLRTFLDVLAQR